MYILKNALKCISRSMGRNILIGVIVLAIAISACLGLSIRQAAENAKEETLADLQVTATISYDRRAMMGEMVKPSEGGGKGSFDREQFADRMGAASGLTLEEYQTYAEAESVKDFYYTLSISLNGSDSLAAVSTESESEGESSGFGGKGGFDRVMGVQSDFSLEGYSSEAAMTAFTEGNATVIEGEIFEEGSEAYLCIISEELAVFNELSVGDTLLFTNPNDEEETYSFKISGIYTDSSANEAGFSIMGATSTDPANKIYTTYAALSKVVAASKASATVETDEETGRENTTALSSQLSATYSFADTDAYYRFEDEVRELGLEESYTVSSQDLTAFEQSMVPLETLSKMAGYFLLVILIIGGIILIVLNIFNVRERKYEIGVLTAMGMKKRKVALQFLLESFVITLAAVMLGSALGGVTAVPVTNALLENQVASQDNRNQRVEQSFGRGDEISEMPGASGGGKNFFANMGDLPGQMNDYITEIDSAMNLTVAAQLLGIAVLLTLVSGAASMLFVMRYDPLKILANRD